MISVVIPTYNSRETLARLLDSLNSSVLTGFETLVVDDASTDGTMQMLESYDVNVLRMKDNKGPSAARNMGVRVAKGDVILFLDSDVVVLPETLGEVDRFFSGHPDHSVMVGVYSPKPANSGSWPLYKALQCYSYYRRFPDITRVTLLWSAVAAFRKDVYLSSGGFDVVFDRPIMEDLEFGRRISGTHPIYLNRRVVVRHHFPISLYKNMKDHFDRGNMWVRIYFKYRKFDNYLSTPRRAFGRLAATAVIPSLLLALFHPAVLPAAGACMLVYLLCNYDLWAVVARRRPLFLPVAFAMDYFLGLVLGLSAVWAVIGEGWKRTVGTLRRKQILEPLVPETDGETTSYQAASGAED